MPQANPFGLRGLFVARRPLALLLQLAVLGAVLAGTLAFVAFDKTVTVSVDGKARQVRTFAGSVRGALHSAGTHVGAHDEVAPGLSAKIANHDKIVVRRGRLLTLSINDQQRRVWVTATNVDDALAQLGLTGDGVYVSASRSRSIGLAGAAFTVRMPQRVRIAHDGTLRSVTTTRTSVAQVLADNKVRLGPRDQTSVATAEYPTNGLTIRVTRVSAKQLIASDVIDHTVRHVADASLFRGDTRTLHDGQDGVIRLVYSVTYINGRLKHKALTSRTTTVRMEPALVAIGTKPVPPPPPVSSPTGGGYSSGSGLNWAALANCESGGNPRAVSPDGTYRGLYQFSIATWQGVGGSGDPIDASSGEQTNRAQVLYANSGRGAWPICGQYL